MFEVQTSLFIFGFLDFKNCDDVESHLVGVSFLKKNSTDHFLKPPNKHHGTTLSG
jgi:hypothetical protein